MAHLHIIPLIGSSLITNFMHLIKEAFYQNMIFRTIFCQKNERTCINVSSSSITKCKYYASRHTSTHFRNMTNLN